MTVPRLTAVRLGGSPRLPLLVLGPSLGTSATALWSACAPALAEHFEVLAWDLPGHGNSTPTEAPFTVEELATAVLTLVDDMLAERGQHGVPFAYAGDSVGGAVGLALLLAAPQRVEAAALICTGARIGTPEGWAERAAAARAAGTGSMVTASAERWFAPGFTDREPVAATLLRALADTDDEGYALVCEALAAFDVRGRLGEVRAPVLAVAGADDVATPPANLAEIADRVRDGRFVVLDGVAHLAPAEQPDRVADLVVRHLTGQPLEEPDLPPLRAAGYAVRREVLGDAHVDRAIAGTTDLTRDFQALITDYAWGSVWTRPGLDRRSRSMITLTALVAGGHHDELAMHVRAARTNGLTKDEIAEVLLHSAVYCGVPAANTAFRIAQGVLDDVEEDQ